MKNSRPATTALLFIILATLLVPTLALAATATFQNPLCTSSNCPTAKDTIKNLIENIITFILGLSAAVALASLIYGGLRLILGASLNESEIAKAKQIIFWSIAGLVVIGMAASILYLLRFILGIGT